MEVHDGVKRLYVNLIIFHFCECSINEHIGDEAFNSKLMLSQTVIVMKIVLY